MAHKTRYPASRMGWHKFYAARFDKTQCPQAEHLACWYLLLFLSLGEAK